MPNRVIHFEIHATNPARAIAFYEKLFDWKFAKWDGPLDYWLITTGDDSTPGINGALIQRMGSAPEIGAPVSAYICTIGVDSVDDTVEAALKMGGVLALPKMAVPGVGWLAYIIDPEVNIFGVMSTDPPPNNRPYFPSLRSGEGAQNRVFKPLPNALGRGWGGVRPSIPTAT